MISCSITTSYSSEWKWFE